MHHDGTFQDDGLQAAPTTAAPTAPAPTAPAAAPPMTVTPHQQVTETMWVECRKCKGSFHPAGVNRHERRCKVSEMLAQLRLGCGRQSPL